MNSFSTDLFRFELTPSNLLITRALDTAQMALSPGEALILRSFLRGYRRWQTRYAQRLQERGYGNIDVPEDDCFKTRAHQFEYNGGRLTIIDLQHDLRMLFEPAHLIRLDDFIRAHQRALKAMPQDLEVPQYFLSPDVEDTPPRIPPFAREINGRYQPRKGQRQTHQTDE